MDRPFSTPTPSDASVTPSKQTSHYNVIAEEDPNMLCAVIPSTLPTPSHHLSAAAAAGAAADPASLLKALEDEMKRTVAAARTRNEREGAETEETTLDAATPDEVDGVPRRVAELRAARTAQDNRTSVSAS